MAASPATSITDDQIRLLRRHNDLIEKLKEVVASQRRSLEALGAGDANSSAPPKQLEKEDSDNEAEEQSLAAAVDKKQSGARREALAAARAAAGAKPDGSHVEDGETERGFMATKPWLGAMSKPTTWDWAQSAVRDVAPTKSMILDHVHGYRSRACRNNVAWVDDKTIVYPVAALCVVMNLQTKKQQIFQSHDDDVLCLDFSPSTRLVASGQIGKQPELHVWNVDRPGAPPVVTFKDHSRAIVAVNFTPDGSKLASIGLDDDHMLIVYDLRSNTKLAAAKTGGNRVVAVYWNLTTACDPKCELVTLGANNISFWTLAGGSLKSRNGVLGTIGKQQTFLDAAFTPEFTFVACESGELYAFEGNQLRKAIDAHNNATFAVTSDPKTDRLITGGRDGFVNVWDRKTMKNLLTFNMNKEDTCQGLNSVKALYLSTRVPNMLLVGTITSSIYSINLTTKQITRHMSGHFGCLERADSYGEIWGVSAHPTQTKYVTTAEDATLRVWDMPTHSITHRIELAALSRCCIYSKDGAMIAVGHEDGSVALFDAESTANDYRQLSRVACRKAATSGGSAPRITCLRFSPDGKKLAVGISLNTVELYHITHGDLVFQGTIPAGSSVPLSIDFSQDGAYLMVSTQAYELLFFTVADGKPFTKTADLKDTQWGTFSSKLGWNVQGIWPGVDGTDVNAVAVSRNRSLVATTEDTGLVKLFNYPCVGSGLNRQGKLLRGPGAVVGVGHSEHVTNVAFGANDAYLVTVGGGDLAVMQWIIA